MPQTAQISKLMSISQEGNIPVWMKVLELLDISVGGLLVVKSLAKVLSLCVS